MRSDLPGFVIVLFAVACGGAPPAPAPAVSPAKQAPGACGDRVCRQDQYCIVTAFSGGMPRGPDEPTPMTYECADQPRATDNRSPRCQPPVDHRQTCGVMAP